MLDLRKIQEIANKNKIKVKAIFEAIMLDVNESDFYTKYGWEFYPETKEFKLKYTKRVCLNIGNIVTDMEKDGMNIRISRDEFCNSHDDISVSIKVYESTTSEPFISKLFDDLLSRREKLMTQWKEKMEIFMNGYFESKAEEYVEYPTVHRSIESNSFVLWSQKKKRVDTDTVNKIGCLLNLNYEPLDDFIPCFWNNQECIKNEIKVSNFLVTVSRKYPADMTMMRNWPDVMIRFKMLYPTDLVFRSIFNTNRILSIQREKTVVNSFIKDLDESKSWIVEDEQYVTYIDNIPSEMVDYIVSYMENSIKYRSYSFSAVKNRNQTCKAFDSYSIKVSHKYVEL